MKRVLFIFVAAAFAITSCEKDDSGSKLSPGDTLITGTPGNNYRLLEIGDNITLDYADLQLYDSSAHIFYFRELHPEFEKLRQVPFTVFAKGDTIYKGNFWPLILSSLPTGPYISDMPLGYQYYALKVDLRENETKDPRNDPRLIRALMDNGLLHSGLAVRITSVIYTTAGISFSFEVTNYDKEELLILDPDRIGPAVFHYFTNGLYFRKLPGASKINVTIPYQTPSPWNGWQKEWFAQLSPGATKAFLLVYPLNSPLAAGDYEVTFTYPGLAYQVAINQVYQSNGRIWLGDIKGSSTISIK